MRVLNSNPSLAVAQGPLGDGAFYAVPERRGNPANAPSAVCYAREASAYVRTTEPVERVNLDQHMMCHRMIAIDGVRISDDDPCWVIAEIGHNHQGDVEKCKQLFREAKAAGASAVKLQKRDNRSLFTREMFDKPYDHENSFGRTYGEHREYLEFGRSEYTELQAFARELGITFFATAFDVPSADFLAALEMPAYKIASADLRNIPLISHVAKIGKPVILSTGGATFEDVRRAYDACMPINPQLVVLQCTSSYPVAFEELDLGVITTYRATFPDVVVGLSAHDNGIAMAVAAYVLGARVIEKHFTLNRAMKGTDHAFSLEPVGLRKMVRDLTRARLAIGDGVKKVYPSELSGITKMGKKIVAARALEPGDVLHAEDVALKSPGDGLPPYELPNVLGRLLLKHLEPDQALELDMLGPGVA
jgi:N-acetylneuraminate synthase/sialic acid synthase